MDRSDKVMLGAAIAVAVADAAYASRERSEPGITQRDLSGKNGAAMRGVAHAIYFMRQFVTAIAVVSGVILTLFGVALCYDWNRLGAFQVGVCIIFLVGGPVISIGCSLLFYAYRMTVKGVDLNDVEGSLEQIQEPWAKKKLAAIRKANASKQDAPRYNVTEHKPSIFVRELVPQRKSKKPVKRASVEKIEQFDKVVLAPKRDKRIRECIFGCIVVFVICVWVTI